ncbi:hypothetical protein [Sulfobacillus sp. hq2]|uniref:hypothetical protein n=1 Tax=Sulfobacillus sp. hq2 TaxID=2039167 RepID=UPI000CD13EF6|nr:hypothetical protein [Sulfobacillus sp. hq2]POB12167.1 hypothetical protein CO251_00645 [Sulfobacillus sp. hq2]
MSRHDADPSIPVLFGRFVVLTSVFASLLWEVVPRLHDQPLHPFFALWAHPWPHYKFFAFGYFLAVIVIAPSWA